MKILVTNDDGVDAAGLWVLVEGLQKIGQVVVVAPHKEQSGVGSSISLRRAIKVKKIESKLEEVEFYSVEGTPADSVIIAVRSLFPGEISLVVSGINRGPNIGHDVFVSGTVGAALQGYLRGIPSLAISINAYEDLDFEVGCRLASLLAASVKDGIFPGKVLLNVNLPNLALSEIGGVEITELSERSSCDLIQRDWDSEEECYRIMRNGEPYHTKSGSDIWALQMNRVSITPLLDNSAVSPLRRCLQDLAPVIYSRLHKI